VAQQFASRDACKTRLIRREQLILAEVGRDRIDSASSFVDYLCESYGFSKSSVWYNLKSLKKKGVLDFATKEEQGKPLALTEEGLVQLAAIGSKRNMLMEAFSSKGIALAMEGRSYGQRDIRGLAIDRGGLA
jgi:hypothetical protein